MEKLEHGSAEAREAEGAKTGLDSTTGAVVVAANVGAEVVLAKNGLKTAKSLEGVVVSRTGERVRIGDIEAS